MSATPQGATSSLPFAGPDPLQDDLSTSQEPPADFSDVALDLQDADGAEGTIAQIVTSAAAALAGDEAGIMLVHSREEVATAASTSRSVEEAHDLQVQLGEGPCLDAIADPIGQYIVDDVGTDPRWPAWGREVVRLGHRSVISVRLETRARRYGSLNLYAAEPGRFDLEDLAVATIFARHASVALASAHDSDGLHRAMDARKLIGVAVGILMERYSLDIDRAFDVLRRHSQDHNVKLRDVAQHVAEGHSLDKV